LRGVNRLGGIRAIDPYKPREPLPSHLVSVNKFRKPLLDRGFLFGSLSVHRAQPF
jgi:hypothetical protein